MELTKHKTNDANNQLVVATVDNPGHGGAHHLYRIGGYDSSTNISEQRRSRKSASVGLLFQNGAIGESGVNGITHEALLAVLIHRLQCFQAGAFANDYNARALTHLEAALAEMHARTLERQARNVEGTHQV